ncbi:hypothetical protein BGZ83_010991 [Gryganskiella cystojenkinii]|nr:hypothetical protein BGZ83_010991 [Gryganskiella cystojenkinii]
MNNGSTGSISDLLENTTAQQQQTPPSPSAVDTPPRVLEYNPHYGPEGQTFTVTLQSNTDKSLRIGFGTLVVESKKYAANGYVTLSCTVPNFAITKWFVSKVPLYILQMENDMVQESWPFGSFEYFDDLSPSNGATNKRSSDDGNLEYGQDSDGSPVPNKRQQVAPGAGGLELSPLLPSTPTSLDHNDDDYLNMPTATASYDASLYSQGLQLTTPYNSTHSPVGAPSYARNGYYNANQMIAPYMPGYSQADLSATAAYALPSSTTTTTANYMSGQQQHQPHHPQPVAPSAYRPQPHPAATMAAGMASSSNSFNPYASLVNKANLKFSGNMEDMAINWSAEEWENQRRLVQFWRRQDNNDIVCSFAPVAPADRQPNSIVVSCIYWAEKNDCFLTSVDTIYLLESLIAVRFTVEEKNRIRRNLEGFRPLTVSKGKAECADFFKLVMSFPNPKPRNIEKDVKVFPWKVLPYALKKIIGKYTASYSSTASIQADAFQNVNFPHGSTMPLTPKQQVIIESSLLVE